MRYGRKFLFLAALMLITTPMLVSAQVDTSPEVNVTWSDTCDDASQWTSASSWDGWSKWDTSTGTLESIDGGLHASTNDGDESGPMWYREITDSSYPFGFDELQVQFSVFEGMATARGGVCVALLDSDLQLICSISSFDDKIDASEITTHYQFGTASISDITEVPFNSQFDSTCRLFGEVNTSIWVEYPDTTQQELFLEMESELQTKTISYITIQFYVEGSNHLDCYVEDVSYSGSNIAPFPPGLLESREMRVLVLIIATMAIWLPLMGITTKLLKKARIKDIFILLMNLSWFLIGLVLISPRIITNQGGLFYIDNMIDLWMSANLSLFSGAIIMIILSGVASIGIFGLLGLSVRDSIETGVETTETSEF